MTVAQLNAVVHQLHAEARPDVFLEASAAQLVEWVRERLGEPATRCYLAEKDGEAIGYVLTFLHERPANCFCPARSWMELNQIAVVSQQRRSGIARALFEEAVAEARRAGISGVELNVWNFNRDAREAFENLGFRARAIRGATDLVGQATSSSSSCPSSRSSSA